LVFTPIIMLTSCYTTSYTYRGNIHQQAIGKTKNEILRDDKYGVPDRTTDDGANGTVLVYERFTQTTVTNMGGSSYGRSSTLGAAIYGNGGIIGRTDTRSNSYFSMSGISQTSLDKTFCHLFLDKNNVVYDFKTNYGALYNSSKCFHKTLTWISATMGIPIFPPIALVTIPWAIIEQKKAKKKGIICRE
jgi:hypothetical protein